MNPRPRSIDDLELVGSVGKEENFSLIERTIVHRGMRVLDADQVMRMGLVVQNIFQIPGFLCEPLHALIACARGRFGGQRLFAAREQGSVRGRWGKGNS